jgi:hypothetical protein
MGVHTLVSSSIVDIPFDQFVHTYAVTAGVTPSAAFSFLCNIQLLVIFMINLGIAKT